MGSKYTTNFNYLQMSNVGKVLTSDIVKTCRVTFSRESPLCLWRSSIPVGHTYWKKLNYIFRKGFKNFHFPGQVLIPGVLKDCRKFNSQNLFRSPFQRISSIHCPLGSSCAANFKFKNVKSESFLTPNLKIFKRSKAGGSLLYLLRVHLKSAEV